MKKLDGILRVINSVMGFLSFSIFIFTLYVLRTLQPKMLSFEPLSRLEENLLTGVGLGLVLILVYYLLSLLQVIRAVRDAARLRLFPLALIILGVLCVLFVFSDVALLRDIHQQYHYGLDQPEWSLVFPILTFQLLYAAFLGFLHVSGHFIQQTHPPAARDINIFLIVQIVGLTCGLMGLGLTSLGFLFPRAWSLPMHTVMGGLILIFPYSLVVAYWAGSKLREKDRVWWDEKQSQDVGKSALLTLALGSALMLGLFVSQYQDLAGVIRLLWLPFYLFGTITFFSAGNLYFSKGV